MKSLFKASILVLVLVSICWAGNLTFLTNATLTIKGTDYNYKAYIDLSSKHVEDGYQTVTLYSHFDQPVSLQGFDGIRWWKNMFQADCSRNVKRLTYIAYLDSDGKVIVDQTIKDDPWVRFDDGEVNSKVKPYLCGK